MEPITWSRAEPKTLLPAALAMYAQGKTRSQVLEAIYGVDLPREAVLCHRDFAYEDEGLAVDWRYHPWELMIPPNEGKRAPFPINDYQSDKDALAYEIAPNVLPLGALSYAADGVRLGGSLFGYDLDELRAGRTTVVGLLNKSIIARSERCSGPRSWTSWSKPSRAISRSRRASPGGTITRIRIRSVNN